jgi:hypothetical protein
MDIKAKYESQRASINNGDIILIRGKSLLAKALRWGCDGSYWNHALVVFKVGDRLFAIQSMAKGVEPDFLSVEIANNIDFLVLRPQFPQQVIDEAVNKAFSKAENGIPYNKFQLLNILIQIKLGLNIKKLGDPNKNICSVFAGITYGGLLPLICYSYEKTGQDYLTPQDFIKFMDMKEIKPMESLN